MSGLVRYVVYVVEYEQKKVKPKQLNLLCDLVLSFANYVVLIFSLLSLESFTRQPGCMLMWIIRLLQVCFLWKWGRAVGRHMSISGMRGYAFLEIIISSFV